MPKQKIEPASVNYTPSKADGTTNTPVLHLKKQFFLFPGVKVRILDGNMHLLAKAYGLPFRLREKIDVYSDEAMRHKVIVSSTKKILDWNVVFQLAGASDGKAIGSLRRHGWSSEFIRDTWIIFNKEGEQVAELLEDSVHKGLIRRFIVSFLPQIYHLKTNSGKELVLKQSWNFIFLHYRGYSQQWDAIIKELGEPLLIGALSTIAIIEGRQ